jgi:pyruvate dehydrogenase E2 component (dihydrolipoamide acetyltransferase)
MRGTTDVIMPVLGMSQDSGRLIRWLKKAGERVEKGEPLMEVETDKAMVEIEAPASGVLTQVRFDEGAQVPVTQVMAVIQDGEAALDSLSAPASAPQPAPATAAEPVAISPLAARMAAEYHLNVAHIKPGGGRIEKADVLAYLDAQKDATPGVITGSGLALASPKARRLAHERGIDLASVAGSGPGGEVLADDVLAFTASPVATPETRPEGLLATAALPAALAPMPAEAGIASGESELPVSAAWARMVERISASWPQTPHFYLMREVDASRLIAWRDQAQQQAGAKITYTDLLVKLVALALRRHPQVGAAFQNGKLIPPARSAWRTSPPGAPSWWSGRGQKSCAWKTCRAGCSPSATWACTPLMPSMPWSTPARPPFWRSGASPSGSWR